MFVWKKNGNKTRNCCVSVWKLMIIKNKMKIYSTLTYTQKHTNKHMNLDCMGQLKSVSQNKMMRIVLNIFFITNRDYFFYFHFHFFCTINYYYCISFVISSFNLNFGSFFHLFHWEERERKKRYAPFIHVSIFFLQIFYLRDI